jgi:hypothetical protein
LRGPPIAKNPVGIVQRMYVPWARFLVPADVVAQLPVFVACSWTHPMGREPTGPGKAAAVVRLTRTRPAERQVRNNGGSHNCLLSGVVVRPSSVLTHRRGPP